MIAITYLLCCSFFYGLFIAMKLIPRTHEFAGVFNDAVSVMKDKALSDDEKEAIVRKAAFSAAKKSALLIGSLATVAVISAVPLVIAIFLNLFQPEVFWAFALEPSVLIATLLGMGTVEVLRRRLKR